MSLALVAVLFITTVLPVSAALTESEYSALPAEEKQFRVYVGEPSMEENLNASGNMVYADGLTFRTEGAAPGSDAVETEVVSEHPFYRVSEWKVWSVNDSGYLLGPEVASGSELSQVATEENFKNGACMNNNVSPATLIQPVLEAVLTCIDYTIPVYDADGQSTGKTVTINAENYADASQVALPGDVEAESWKLLYNDADEYAVETAEEIWTKGITVIGGDFDASRAKLCAVVSPKVGTASFIQPGWYVGESMPQPQVSSDTNGTDHISYYYKAAGADDSTYTTVAPTTAGSYRAKAVFAATGRYMEVEVTSDFAISYLPVQEGAYSVSGFLGADGWYVGDINVLAGSGYQIRHADSNVWSDRITVTESSSVSFYLMADSGAQTQAVTIEGLKVDQTAPVYDGANDGITIGMNRWNSFLDTIRFGVFPVGAQTVTIQAHDPESGIAGYEYLVSSTPLSLDQLQASTAWSTGSSFLMSSAGGQEQIVYARVTNQAGLSSYISSDGIVYDTTAPLIRGVSDGGTYYGERITVNVTDDYLSRVTVNGILVNVSDNRAGLILEASDTAYTLVATDISGNRTECTVSVLESWMRDGITGSGRKQLKTGTAYRLGSGQWTVGGDGTVYTGGSTFYVKTGGAYDFRLQ